MNDNELQEYNDELLEVGPQQQQGPLQMLSRLFRFDFCASPDVQSSAGDDLVSRSEHSRNSHGIGGFDTVILTYPFDTLKKALQHGFCDPLYPEHGNGDSSVMIRTCVSDETEIASRQRTSSLETKIDESMMDTDEDGEVLVVTQPGTGRWVRASRALEIFFFTIFLLGAAFRLLQWLNVEFSVEFKQLRITAEPSGAISDL